MKRRLYRLAPLATAAAVFFLLRAASPETVERVYSDGVYPPLAHALGTVSDLVPFSIAEIWAYLLLAGALFLAGRAVVRLVRRRFSWRRAGRFWRNAILVVAPAVYVAFVLLWGANYARVPVEAKIGYAAERVTPERLREVFAATARETAGRWDAGRLPCDVGTLARTADAVDRAVTELEGRPVPCARRAKTLLANGVFRLAGIHGVTIPFTHEALHRDDLFSYEIPWIAAHERAHLAGYGSEAEANYVAWLACSGSDDRLIRYSGVLGLLRYLLGAMGREERRAAYESLDGSVRADLAAIWTRGRAEESAATEAARRVNDAYLRANRVEAGVADYGRVVRLVLGARAGFGEP